jgi:hypothetical protein
MVTFFVGDLDFEIKLDVHQRLAYYNHAFQANKQHGKGYTSKTKVKVILTRALPILLEMMDSIGITHYNFTLTNLCNHLCCTI